MKASIKAPVQQSMWETKIIVCDDRPALLIRADEQQRAKDVVCWGCRDALTEQRGYVLLQLDDHHLINACCIVCRAIFVLKK